MPIRWTINLDDLKNGAHIVETTEGVRRSGKITDVVYKETTIYDQQVRFPSQLIMNNDQSDFIQWELVKSISKVHGA